MRTLAVCVALVALSAAADEGWRLRLVSNDGIDDPNNAGVSRMIARGDWLFLGTWNTHAGMKVYRSRDGAHWERISEGGINGDPDNFAVVGFVWFGNHLYVGSWNQRDGAAMFRARADAPNAGDVVWEEISTDGLDNPRNWGFTHMREFSGDLYAGCFNFTEGSEVFRSASGDAGTWAMIAPKAWGSKVNTDSTMMLVHGGHLYVGTETARDVQYTEGTALWRTDGDLSPPYNQWQQVNTNGFGDGRNHNICGLAEFRGKIYAATWNQTEGFEVWRATPGDKVPFGDWERVIDGGYNDTANVYTTCMTTFEDMIFVSSIGTFETVPALYFLPNAKLKSAHGGLLIVSRDGEHWEELDAPGFAEPPDIGIQWLTPFQGRLYIGTQAIDRTMRLWVYERASPED